MMLTGSSVHAAKARRLGLVDAVVEERHVAGAVGAAISGGLKPARRNWTRAAYALAPVRRFVGKRMRAEVEKRAPERHYPA
ncbi:hypothetical protein, partial [Klebsiella aerogenes]|uniref:hypothetical protein n=1 Tax=Klebsiella aerogenes TaxID=548 RepID=UPI003F6873DB